MLSFCRDAFEARRLHAVPIAACRDARPFVPISSAWISRSWASIREEIANGRRKGPGKVICRTQVG